MSLIVARKWDRNLRMVSDTKLTTPESTAAPRLGSPPSEGAIKAIITHPAVCIGFAGIVEYAEAAIAEARQCKSNFDLVRKILLEHHKASRAVDFIICCGAPRFRIYVIKGGTETTAESAWIGSLKGLSLYQKIYHQSLSESNNNVASAMGHAMERVISSSLVEDVSGFCVQVGLTTAGFKYVSYMHSYPGHFETQINLTLNEVGIIPLTHGSAQQGSYTINFYNSNGAPGVALHLLQGNFGVVYLPRNSGGLLWPIIINDVDEFQFYDKMKSEYGLTPMGFTGSRQRSLLGRAQKASTEGDVSRAIEYAHQGIWQDENSCLDSLYFVLFNSLISQERFVESMIYAQVLIARWPKYRKHVNRSWVELIEKKRKRKL